MKTLTIGSRRSALAQAQSQLVRHMLLAAWPDLTVTIELIDTTGDLNRQDPLPAIGGKGLFTAELEEALRHRHIDLAVHSLKDLPVEDSPGLTVVAIPKRGATEDVLISRQATSLAELLAGAVIGTSSPRRAAQILAIRPDVLIRDIRGNVNTRLAKIDDPASGYSGTLLALAGLSRLGYETLPQVHRLPHALMLPAPGQGALAVQGRVNDPETTPYLAVLDHTASRAAVTAERAFLAGLGGGCSLPVAALGQINGPLIELQALVADAAGQNIMHFAGSDRLERAEGLGRALAQQAISQGATPLLFVEPET